MLTITVAALAVIIGVLLIRRRAASKRAATANARRGAEFLAGNKLLEGVQTTASGLQYLQLRAGDGGAHPSATDRVKVHYHGSLVDGSVFDSSVDRGQPIEFGLNQVIAGWTEGLQLMVVGDKMRLFIPSELAYGNRGAGTIGPGETLIFDVELLGINGG